MSTFKKKTFYITTAIDYPNGRPHIGHAYEKVIADVLTRWHRLKGEDTFFLTGTDENAQKNVEAAKNEGKETLQFLDEKVVFFKELCKKLTLSHDRFIRTTEEEHKKVAQSFFKKVFDKGDIYKGFYEGLYCQGCERFYTEKDLIDNCCPEHKRPVKHLKEESYFFKMSKYQQQLIDHIDKYPELILPDHKRKEILNRLKEPLRDLSVTRTSITWGVRTPIDDTHVIYVWFDALINYLSGIDFPDKKFKRYWPAVHIIGKDITWFHTVIWPIMLLSADIPLPTTVHSHGFVNYKGEKLSKTTGNTVDPLTIIDRYTADALRYYLLREIPAGHDGDYSEESIIERANADIADSLGNLVNRVCILLHKYNGGKIPKPSTFTDEDHHVIKQLPQVFKESDIFMKEFFWHRAADRVWSFVHELNKYITKMEPWKITDTERRDTVLYVLTESLRCIIHAIAPFIPTTAEKIADVIGQHITTFNDAAFKETTTGTVKKGIIVFKKLEQQKTETSSFSKLNLKVAIVDKVEDHPNADKLYVLSLDVGAEKRTIVAGIKSYISKGKLQGKHIVIVSNLKPVKMRGVESNGMLLAADKGDVFALLETPNTPAGEQVVVEGVTPQTDQVTYREFSKIVLTVKNKKAFFNNATLKTVKEDVIVDIDDDASIR